MQRKGGKGRGRSKLGNTVGNHTAQQELDHRDMEMKHGSIGDRPGGYGMVGVFWLEEERRESRRNSAKSR